MLDHDDEPSVDSLYEYVKLLNNHLEADLIYSDEEKIDVNGNRMEPFFKPDYSPVLLLSMNYICHFSMFRRFTINDINFLICISMSPFEKNEPLRFARTINK